MLFRSTSGPRQYVKLGGIPVGLDELDVLARAGRGDLHEHVATVASYRHDRNRLLGKTCHYKSLLAARQLLVFIATKAPFMRLAREKCRTRVDSNKPDSMIGIRAAAALRRLISGIMEQPPHPSGPRHSDDIISSVIVGEEKTFNIHGRMPWSCEPAGNRVYSRLLGVRNDQDDGGKPGMLFG